jgi:hypothetical protein
MTKGAKGSSPKLVKQNGRSAMLEKLREIDIKAVKSLVKLKDDKNQVRGFLDKAGELRDKVDKTVFERVKGDYERRHAELDMQSIPLKDEAREEYRKLVLLSNQIEEAFEEARVDKEELEFRHAVGELSEKDLQDQLKEAEKAVSERQSEMAEAEKLKKQFIEAFDSEEELEGDSSGVDEPDGRSATLSIAGGPVSGATRIDSDLDRTRVVPFDAPPDTGERSVTDTFILPEACLVTLDEEGEEGRQYSLGAFNYIGRTEENQIQITLPGISRKHALLSAGPDGFLLQDLQSHNGTFVNEERVDEHRLEDGDLIGIGNVRLLFRLLSQSDAKTAEG